MTALHREASREGFGGVGSMAVEFSAKKMGRVCFNSIAS